MIPPVLRAIPLQTVLHMEFVGSRSGEFLDDYNERRPGPPLPAVLPAFPGGFPAGSIKQTDA